MLIHHVCLPTRPSWKATPGVETGVDLLEFQLLFSSLLAGLLLVSVLFGIQLVGNTWLLLGHLLGHLLVHLLRHDDLVRLL